MPIERLPQTFRLTIDLTRQEATEVLDQIAPGFYPQSVNRLVDELGEIRTFDRPGEGGESQ